ncbi:MAG: ankyrin repeat domain-containing protein [Pseudomonadota bacterium]|nr:ankyrin repeat domain-containing protein [Pseudomonadota bacterium]
MKHLLLTTIAAVVLVGCGESQSLEPPTAKAPDISIHEAVKTGNIEAVKQHLAGGTDVNAKADGRMSALHKAAWGGHKEIAELLIAKGADVDAKGCQWRNRRPPPQTRSQDG